MQRKIVRTDPKTGKLVEEYVDRGRGGHRDPAGLRITAIQIGEGSYKARRPQPERGGLA